MHRPNDMNPMNPYNASTGQMVFYPQPGPGGYPQQHLHPGMNMTDHMGRMTFHETPHGRMALPMSGGPQVVTMNHGHYTPSPATDDGTFEPMDEGAPHLALGSHSPSLVPASLRHPHHPVISPTDERMRWHSQHQHQQQQILHHQHQQHMQAMVQMMRPAVTQRHSMMSQPIQRPSVQRHHSLQVGPSRAASPQIVGDIFDAPGNGSPVRRANSSLGFEVQPPPMELDEAVNSLFDLTFPAYIQYFTSQEQPGITPSRALGPPPSLPFSFTNLASQPAVTPNDKRNVREEPSSAATSMTATSSSSSSSGYGERINSQESIDRRSYKASSESPSRAASVARAEPSTRPVVRPARSGVIGGRTSAKFSRVAVDPGVEGCPPGPRSKERPSPSFACIIGQAILAASAGGLSLDHIYRYVETVYPFFTPGEAAWRNSVRHNLSIHKMFETIPRTEDHPPGKGGIWVISEEERCHWPAPDKFVKNFPPTHHHHATCKQTLHEAEKEQALIDKHAAEGTIYVPKKAKKTKKGGAKDKEEGGADMVRTLSAQEMVRSLSIQSDMHMASSVAPQTLTPQMMHLSLPPQPTFDQSSSIPLQPSSSFDGTMAPPRFGVSDKRRMEDDENVFGNSVKRVRLTQGIPLHPIDPDTKQFFQPNFITPERDRAAQFASSSKMASSSTAKTPALVNTSSSPGSSPMPPTVPRATHNPSALHQGWTHDDIEDSPARQPLGAAFDFEIPKPKPARKAIPEEEFVPMGPPPAGLAPKTPVTRSSAHQKPRTPMEAKTPFFSIVSPMFPVSSGDFLDTPGWEARGCIDRLGNCSTGTESPDGSRDMARYSLASASNSGSPAKKRTIST